ncbi:MULTISPECIES: phosphatase [Providencia]|uniref:Phosphatase n=1 Tax=Providencia rettgeri TaxID=587 RepID=A0AB35L9Z8_PRORE|nr:MULTISPECIES: phosphatase [Providencia]AWS51818.1 phosphatase [Providencia rettgeri]MBG5922218.1 phosphatase [Providencia rettgeri]MBI6192339.1 phosphatase [Providencia rettgeri]MBO8253711.1 phosphatase [Providencia rettgeri]MBO8257555.1 phosphatase [Providencia rettgeri]
MYQVDLHAHTIASTHAYSTVNEYFAEAASRGVKLFAITDHGPEMQDAPHEWHFGNMPILPRIVDGVGLLYGIEANIKNKLGETDCNEKIARHLDIILAGFHEPVLEPQSLADNTEAMIATIRSGKVQIITHPGNPKYPIDIKAVAQAAKECNVALEMNNSSFLHSRAGSQQNCLEIAKAVKETGGWVALGSDSHFAGYLGRFDRVVEMLESISFPQSQILNVSPRRVLDFLVSHGRKPIAEFADF